MNNQKYDFAEASTSVDIVSCNMPQQLPQRELVVKGGYAVHSLMLFCVPISPSADMHATTFTGIYAQHMLQIHVNCIVGENETFTACR